MIFERCSVTLPCRAASFGAFVLLSLVALAAGSARATPTLESVEWLGWPSGARSISYVTVNDAGDVALTATMETIRTQGFVQLTGGWGSIPAWQCDVASIDESGAVTGWRTTSDSGPTHGYRWSPTHGLATTEGAEPAGTTSVRAVATSADGVMVGRICLDTGVCWPFTYGGGALIPLTGTVSNGEVMALNASGQLLTRAYSSGGDRYDVFVIEADESVTPLPRAPWDYVRPLDIGDDGVIVGDAENPSGTTDDAFVYDGTWRVLPRPAGFASADAHAINDFGQIAGWGYDGSFSAIVWENEEPFDLSELAAQTLGMPHRLKKAFDISDTGWVVGWGTNPSTGSPEIFRAKLGEPCRTPDSGQGMITWTGSGGSYDDTDNWSADFVPGAEEVVRFDASGGGVITVPDGTTNTALVIDGGQGSLFDLGDGSWQLAGGDPCLASLVTRSDDSDFALYDFSGGRLQLDQGAELGHGRGLVMSVSGQVWDVTGAPLIAGHPDTTTLGLSLQSRLEVDQDVLLGLRTGTRARLSLNEGTMSAHRFVLGSRGYGELQATSVQVLAESIELGEIAGGRGKLVVTGPAASFLSADGEVVVGAAGSGILELASSSLLAQRLVVAGAPGSVGNIFVGIGGSIDIDDVTVGSGGSGSLVVGGSGTLSQTTTPDGLGWVVLGSEPDSYGEFGVLGAGASATIGGLVVGSSGRGYATLQGNSVMRVSGSILIGDAPGGEGTLEVEDSYLQSAAIFVGLAEGATGTLRADSLAVVVTDLLEVGEGGRVEGNILALESTGIPRHADFDPGLRATALMLDSGATVAVDSVRFGDDFHLGGGGTFAFDVTNPADVDPGRAEGPGALTIDGDYAQTTSGRLHIDVFATAGGPARALGRREAFEADRLVVTGQATLAGVLELGSLPELELGLVETFTVVEAAGGVVGSFDAVQTPSGIEAEVVTGPADIRLTLRRVAVSASTLELSAQRVANGAQLRMHCGFSAEGGVFDIEHAHGGGAWSLLGRHATESLVLDGEALLLEIDTLAAGDHRFRARWRGPDGYLVESVETTLRVPSTSRLRVSEVAPNPFNPRATLSVGVAETGRVRVTVLDLRGRRVGTLFDGRLEAGADRVVELDAEDWASGVYLVDVWSAEERVSRKMIVVK